MLSPFVLEHLGRLQLAPRKPPPAPTLPYGKDKLPGIEVTCASGRCWRIDKSLSRLLGRDHDDGLATAVRPEADSVIPMPPPAQRNGGREGRVKGGEHDSAARLKTQGEGAKAHAEIASLCEHFPQSVLLLDIETCGFSGAAIFLIGVLRWRDDRWQMTQMLARDYSEELAILRWLEELADGKSVLVTFNGKCFDVPMIEDRRARYRLAPLLSNLRHCDLLHHARRRWRHELPDCRLQTLEQSVCRRHRVGDVPGSQVPLAYHEFVRTGELRRIREVLDHNALDLATLWQLARVLMASPVAS